MASQPAAAAVLADIFGSDSDSDAPAPAAAAAAPAPRAAAKSTALAVVPPADGEDDDEEEGGGRAAKRAPEIGPPLQLVAPLPPPPPPALLPVLLRQSNIFQVQQVRFDAEAHEVEGYVEWNAASGRQEVRAFDHNVVRWRFNPTTGEPESNARFVRWSDGSLQLQLGGETLDASLVDVSRDHGHLFARMQGANSALAAQGSLGWRLTLRPSTLDSKSHKLLAASAAQRHAKVTRVKQTITEMDPEAEKAAREKEEKAAERDADARERKRKAVERNYMALEDGRQQRASGLMGAMSKEFLEDDDAEEEEPRARPVAKRPKPAAKPAARRGGQMLHSSDDDDAGERSWSDGGGDDD